MTNRTTAIYITAYLIVYSIATAILMKIFHEPIKDILTVFFSLGIVFSLIAWYLTKKNYSRRNAKPALPKEAVLIAVLIAWIVLYISFGSGFIDGLIPKGVLQNKRLYAFLILIRKLWYLLLSLFLHIAWQDYP